MKQLETQFTQDNHNFTQVKRSSKAAIYKRETLEGTFISFEVFAILSKDGEEVYPNQSSIGKWAWTPIKQDRAERYFNNIENGDTPIPSVDPITGEFIRTDEENKSLDDVLAENPDIEVATVVIAEVDPTLPDVAPVAITDSPIVVETPASDVLVEVATVTTKNKVASVNMVIPTGEFTQAQFALANNLPERGVVWGKLDSLVKAGKLKKEFKKLGKGRPSACYQSS
jgi:hypothetical protein